MSQSQRGGGGGAGKHVSMKQRPYICDVKLLPRVRQYLANKSASDGTDVETVVTYLQNTFQDYRRKKRNTFRHSVSRALDVLVEELGDDTSDEDVDILSAKRPTEQMTIDKKDVGLSESDTSFSADAIYAEYQDGNAVNNVVTGLYSRQLKVATPPSHSPSQSTVPSNAGKKTGFLRCQSDPVIAKDTQLDNLAFIDRGQNPSTPLNPSKLIESLPASPRVTHEEHFENNNTNMSKMVSTGERPVIITIGDDDDGESVQNEPSNPTKPHEPRNPAKPLDNSTSTPVGKRKDLETNNSSRKKHKPASKQPKNENPASATSTSTPSAAGSSKKKGAIDAIYSKTKFSQIGGNEKTLKEVQQLLLHMRYPQIYQQIGVTPPRGFLLHGPPGCGKTLMAHAIAGELELPFFKLAATELVSGVSGESEERVRSLFNKAAANAPCILFIDEVDSITPKRETASKDMERRIVSQFLACLDDLCEKKDAHVLVIGATNRPDSLDPALRRAGRFDREICMGIPDVKARESILKVLCKDIRLADDFDYSEISHLTPGYVGADLSSLVREAAMSAVNKIFASIEKDSRNRNDLENGATEPVVKSLDTIIERETVDMEVIEGDAVVTAVTKSTASEQQDSHKQSAESQPGASTTSSSPPQQILRKDDQEAGNWWKKLPAISTEQLKCLHIDINDFLEAVKVVQPSAKREGFATVPDVTWDDIGALKAIREELQMAILAPIKYPNQFKSLGLNSPSGVLLAGPPGCGKTLLAKAIANESGINFISVKGPELINMYVGESEKAVRQVFQRARNSSPCVVFFDELDSLCPRRSLSGSDGGSGSRIVNQMLTEMDGLEERKQVFVMGATNRPDIIDPAVLRPGRLDKTLYVGLPTLEDRIDILRTITKNCTKPPIEGVDLAEIAALPQCDDFSGADLTAVIREASMAAMKQYISSTEKLQDTSLAEHKIILNRSHFDIALDKIKPSISATARVQYQKMALT